MDSFGHTGKCTNRDPFPVRPISVGPIGMFVNPVGLYTHDPLRLGHNQGARM